MSITIRDAPFEAMVESAGKSFGGLKKADVTKALAQIGYDALRRGKFIADPNPSNLVADPASGSVVVIAREPENDANAAELTRRRSESGR